LKSSILLGSSPQGGYSRLWGLAGDSADYVAEMGEWATVGGDPSCVMLLIGVDRPPETSRRVLNSRRQSVLPVGEA